MERQNLDGEITVQVMSFIDSLRSLLVKRAVGDWVDCKFFGRQIGELGIADITSHTIAEIQQEIINWSDEFRRNVFDPKAKHHAYTKAILQLCDDILGTLYYHAIRMEFKNVKDITEILSKEVHRQAKQLEEQTAAIKSISEEMKIRPDVMDVLKGFQASITAINTRLDALTATVNKMSKEQHESIKGAVIAFD